MPAHSEDQTTMFPIDNPSTLSREKAAETAADLAENRLNRLQIFEFLVEFGVDPFMAFDLAVEAA